MVNFKKSLTSISILGEDVEVVESYRYLGVHLDNRPYWTHNTVEVYKKGVYSTFWKLRYFNLCNRMLYMFYQSVVAGTIFFTSFFFNAGTAGDTSRLNKLIRKAGLVIGTNLDSLESVMHDRLLVKLLLIMKNVSHPFH